uniref:Uncharacterized protein n=2 Tax=Picea TaxID=3328 RepID=A0A124GP51_PICGL|nr:hypothetical protein ABT39_MTgene703 [Picea glauca]QHR90218.1 hypothetical protein Q903MT_gene4241 [Picea sitchensis]
MASMASSNIHHMASSDMDGGIEMGTSNNKIRGQWVYVSHYSTASNLYSQYGWDFTTHASRNSTSVFNSNHGFHPFQIRNSTHFQLRQH